MCIGVESGYLPVILAFNIHSVGPRDHVLCWTVILSFPSMQTASRIRCVFYDVAANGGCSLHLCTYDCGSVLCVASVNFMLYSKCLHTYIIKFLHTVFIVH